MTSVLKSYIYIPLVFWLIFAVGLLGCYGIALNSGRIVSPPLAPFVSEIGASSPESSLFTFVLAWASFFGFATILFYYKYVIQVDKQSKLNTAAFVFGVITMFGAIMLGSFQFMGDLVTPHLIGAFLTFAGILTYMWLVIALNFKQLATKPQMHCAAIVYVRLAMAIVQTITFFISIITYIVVQFTPNSAIISTSTYTEWIFTYTSITNFATLAYDLSKIRGSNFQLEIEGEVVKIDTNLGEDTKINAGNPNPNYTETETTST